MKNPKINESVSDAFLRVLGGAVRAADSNGSLKRPKRQGTPSCESLEGRVVLSNFGGADLLGGISQVGVVTNVMEAGGPRGGQTSQTDAAWRTLQTEIQGLAAKSDVTVADLSALASDSQAIATAGGGLKADGLQTVLGTLAAAVAGGGDTTQAQADFNALFSGSTVDQATIDKTFTDLVQTIKDSNITADDASLIASDQAAVQADFAALPQGGMGGGPGGMFGGPGDMSGAPGGKFGGPGGMFGGRGGISGQTNQWGGTGASDHATAGNAGTATAVPATSSESVPSQTVTSNSGTTANNAATVSLVTNNAVAGGEVRGRTRALFGRSLRGGVIRNTAGGAQASRNTVGGARSAHNTAGGTESGGVQNRASAMNQLGGFMNRMRRR
jgi:hypothetical protein